MVANAKPRKQSVPPEGEDPRSGIALHYAKDCAKGERTFGDIGPVLVHDFKGPLSAIALNLDFVMEQLPQDSAFDGVRAALSECRQAEERIFRVIANLLDVARCEEGRLSLRIASMALAEIIGSVIAEHEEEISLRAIDLVVKVPDDLPQFETDADLFSRVLHNLIDNALRSTKNGGTVVVTARAHDDDLEIRVANDGPPISPTLRPHLFQRSLGTENSGTGANRGLGLYFCRLALAELGASISLADGGRYPVCFVIRHPLQAQSVQFTSSSEFPKSRAIPI